MAAEPTDLGPPTSYLTLKTGSPVYSCDGEMLGKVAEVLSAVEQDIFDGLVLDAARPLGGRRYVAGEQVEEIFERGLLLKLDLAAAKKLPERGRG